MKEWLIAVIQDNPVHASALFIIGVLMVIIIQNFFLYFNQKDRSYLWYSIYGFIILVDQFSMLHNSYIVKFYDHGIPHFGIIHNALEWLYNSAYLIFVIEFGGIYLLPKRKAKNIKLTVSILVGLLLLFFISDIFVETDLVRQGFLFLLVPSLITLSIIIYFHLFKMQTYVKYYLISGSLSFTIFSILALATAVFIKGENGYQLAWLFFYIGVFVENIFFSLGLMAKQKMVLRERNETQKKLIVQLKENEELKNTLTEKLQEEVSKKTSQIVGLIEKAEREKTNKLEIAFEKQLAEMKVTSLQSQMNPHFIFNSLNSIKLYIIKNDKKNAVYYLSKFSKLIRKILSASREKEVSLQEELDTIALYVYIENIRFDNTIDFAINVEKGISLSSIKLPPLILQPFIENSIWHGLSPKKGKKKLHINIKKQDKNHLEIAIIDNGVGRDRATEIKKKKLLKKTSIGLVLTEERMLSFSKKMNNEFELEFIDLFDGEQASGTKVLIRLPLH